MRAADEVLIVIDDTVLGLTALDLFLGYAKALVVGPERLSFLVNGYSGSLLAVPQIQSELEPAHRLGERPWRLPPVPVDPKASLWPGSGRTLYSMGTRETRAALEKVATDLNLISHGDSRTTDPTADGSGKSSWISRLLPKGKVEDEEELL